MFNPRPTEAINFGCGSIMMAGDLIAVHLWARVANREQEKAPGEIACVTNQRPRGFPVP